ncbi:fatty acid-binding protein, heart-like [Babylonia areolata]|uniref:fatty acid-binding protein, heart-like n=1 Tax=Babylonia areolata TaxID=304850 RepID=UPI003FD05533
MAEAFVGKWTVDLSSMTGLEEFAAATGMTAEKLEQLGKLSYFLEFSVSGETITATVGYDADIPTRTYTFKPGDTFDFHTVDGSVPKLTVTMEGGRMVEDYKLGEGSWQTVREVDGNVMTSTTTARGASAVQKLNKQ